MSFDFTKAGAVPGLDSYLNHLPKSAEEYRTKISTELTISRDKVVRRFDDKSIEKMFSDFKRRMIESRSKNPFQVYREALSDHIPIAMICETGKDDD